MADGTDAGVFWSSFASCPVPWERRVPFDLRRGYEPCGICLVGLRSSLAICKEDSCLLRKKGSEPDPRVSLCSLDSRCCGCLVMGTCSSGENSIVKVMPVKARKPYTIRKQRERWTEDEHNKFLEALKLYGRAWQRIEEHIGTKTAVQIRSHAQKFFSKLEKEAVAKGIPLEKVHDIEIPPPRPKRKPNKPYPRKICVGTVSTCVEGKDDRPIASLSSRKNILELGRDSHRKKHTLIQSLERTKGTSKASKCSDSLSLFQDAASCTSVPLACKGPIDACTFREFVPLVKEIKGKTTDDEYSSTVKERVPNNTNSDIDRPERLSIDTEMNLPKEVIVGREPPQKYCIPLNNEIEGCKNYPKHVFVDPIDGDGSKTVKSRGPNATNLTSISNKFGVDTNSNFGTIPSISATTGHHDSTSLFSVHQPFVAFSPLTQFFGMEDAYRSFLNISPTFSSLIISSLLQIPAAHAAASLATSLWPTVDVEAPIDSVSETIGGRIPVRCMNPSPSMETTASVSSWGATHGMLPFCHPGHSCFTFVPAPVNIIPRTGTSQTVEDNKEKEVEVSHHCAQTNQQTVDLKLFEAPRSKSFPLSSSDSDQSWEGENHYAVEQRSLTFNHPNSKPDSFLLEVNKAPLNHLPSTDTSNCWSRGSHSVSESPKEATKEGGLAFRALFSKEVLTQSFLPSRTEDRMMENDKDEKHVAALPVEANSSTLATANDDHAHVADRSCSTNAGNNTKKGLLTDEIGQGKLKSPKTGFKPYKRCSIEARENKAAPHEEKCNKKIRLDGDTSL